MIACYGGILSVFPLETEPEMWAGFQNDLGGAYLSRISGHKSENLNQAITFFQKALQVFNREDYPQKWAVIKNNLAILYSDDNLENQEENLTKALKCCQEVLQVVSKKTFPREWADAQNNLGYIYRKLDGKNRTENLEQIIIYYQKALQIFTYETAREDWARTKLALACAYRDRIEGEKQENIKQVIDCCQDALKVYTYENYPPKWAEAKVILAKAYTDNYWGNRTHNLEQAIAYYKDALQFHTYEYDPVNWAKIYADLGIAYYSYHGDNREENIKKAIACYENSLKVFTRDKYPDEWATVQNNLASAYSLNFSEDKTHNSEQGIKELEKALNKSNYGSEHWATTKLNLANLYLFRNFGDRADNLEKALEFYQEALQVFKKETFPELWGASQYGLAMVFRNRVMGNRENNLEQAIRDFQSALEVQTIDRFPEDYARCQHNLAKAYLAKIYKDRIRGDEVQQLEKAIAQNLEKAIECFNNALLVRTREKLPYPWAVTQHQLGMLYWQRSLYEKKPEYLAQAIEYFESELEVLDKEKFPDDRGRAEGALANAYTQLYLKIGRAKNWEKARTHAYNHLAIFQKNISPRDYVEGLSAISGVYLAARRWNDAYEKLKEAINCIEDLRSITIAGDEAKQKLAEKHSGHYVQMVQVCLELNNYTTALEYVERSKARNLVELLANKEIYPKFDLYHNSEIYQTHCQELEQLRRQIPAIQRNLAELERDIQKSEDKEMGDLEQKRQELTEKRQELNQLQKNLNKLIAEINKIDSRFAFTQKVQSIPFRDIQALTDENTAIVEWYVMGSQILTFIITCHHPHPIVVPFEDIKALESWEREYRDTYENQKAPWIKNLGDKLQNLAKILHIDEILSIIEQHFVQNNSKCNRLILIPHRYLHLFPLHALPLADGRLLFEHFPQGVGYAPSCQLLKQAKDQEQNRPDFTRLFAIQNPTRQPVRPLLGSQLEINKISQHFDLEQSIILKEAEATETNLYQNMKQIRSSHCLHFSCHGKFDPNSPLKSALRLANPEGTLGEEANLTLGEVFEKLYLNQCRLVTFSACESGMTDPNSISDEYIGLPSGFLYAGSLSVVSTLWSVDPIATTLLMVKFYKNLNRLPEIKTGDVAIALNKAQTWLKTLTYKKWARIQNHPQFQKLVEEAFGGKVTKEKEKEYKKFKKALKTSLQPNRQPFPFANPYYWSAFVAIGI